MTLSQDPSQFDRPDLSSRMAPRRRLPRPSASATSSTLQNGIVGQPTQPGFTFSQFLGMFDEEPPTLSGGFHPPGVSYLRADSYPFDAYGPGPSRTHSGSYRGFQPSPYVVESGWSKDVFGKDLYVGHGRIEEVDDEAAVSGNRGGDEESNVSSPQNRKTASIFHSEEYPLISTPPPCPRPKNLPSLRETSTTSDIRTFQPFSAATLPMTLPPLTSTNATSPLILDERSEINILRENLSLLGSSLEDVKFMNTYFLANSIEHDLSRHVDLCTRLEESLGSLTSTLTSRFQIGAEEWNVRSSSWHQKYCKRLFSLRTTLQRLTRMRQLIGNPPFRPRQRLAILAKLEQHEAKLADLASKYGTAFDRLRLRHLHFLLTQAHMEARQQKAMKARSLSRASFERRWNEGKRYRATLRSNFHDLRQEFYSNSQRSGRHAYAP
ncbi:hypothetical protein M413DRAFT_446562 [Hebeloma cylindrosporum]|uniref:Uncharacterized protein n=1 Tax=Hebeloma cylindrosporum TaxID=76867 RepID=A0A0C3C825_HEBCY|nr:hypothetical protein M413DRAFT_446562 [Hebeloma cylindrosporum h7]